jgi:hypothetical protein
VWVLADELWCGILCALGVVTALQLIDLGAGVRLAAGLIVVGAIGLGVLTLLSSLVERRPTK